MDPAELTPSTLVPPFMVCGRVDQVLFPIPGSLRRPCYRCGFTCVVSRSGLPFIERGTKVLCDACWMVTPESRVDQLGILTTEQVREAQEWGLLSDLKHPERLRPGAHYLGILKGSGNG